MPKARAKQQHLTPEEVKRATELKMDLSRKRGIIIDEFFPALTGATVSVDEAKMLLQSINTLMMEEVLKTMKLTKFDELKEQLLARLCPNGDRLVEVTALLDTIKDETLFSSREITEGMARAIDQMIMDEMRQRTLNTFTPDWEKYLTKQP